MKVSCLIIIALFASVAAAAAAAAAAAIGDEQLPHDEPVAAKNGEQCVKSTDCSEISYCSNVRNIVARAGEVDAKPVEGICVAKVGINLPCFASVECLGYPNTKAESKSSITGNDYVNKEQFEADVLAVCQRSVCKVMRGHCNSQFECINNLPCKKLTEDGSKMTCTNEQGYGESCTGDIECFSPLACIESKCIKSKIA